MLTAEQQAEILTMHFNDKRSVRSIAMALGINRDTVRRTIRRRTVSLSPRTVKRVSIVEPFKNEIMKMFEKDPYCPSTAIMNQIRALGYMGGITAVRDYIRAKREVPVRAREASTSR